MQLSQGVRLLGSMGILYLVSYRAFALFSIVVIHCHQQQRGATFSPHTPPAFIGCRFFDDGPSGMRWRLTVVLICVSLMVSDAECLFMCLLSIWRNVFLE